jgi:hypothetical protein
MTIDAITLALATVPAPVAKLAALKGQFVRLAWTRPVAYKKGLDKGIVKETVATVRIGVQYDNIAAVQEQRADGTIPSENQGLRGRHWVIENCLLKSEKDGSYLLRCAMVKNNDGCKPTVRYLKDGVEVAREVALEGTLASENKTSEQTDQQVIFDLKVQNLMSVNGVAI